MAEVASPEIGKYVHAENINTNFIEERSGAPLLLLQGSGPGVTAYANRRLTIPAPAKSRRVLAIGAQTFNQIDFFLNS
jgi:2-hydroxymuconate-semialdehyde hydrolase